MNASEQHTDLIVVPGETAAGLKSNPEQPGSRRDPEERPVRDEGELRERNLDKTLADSFPTSDPPSSIPDPCGDHETNREDAA